MGEYDRAIALAKRLIKQKGRPVTMVRFAEEGVIDADVIVPGCFNVFVPASSLQSLGLAVDKLGLFAKSSQVSIMATDDVNDFELFDQMIDGDKTWTVDHVDKLKPGEQVILYFVGVSG